MTAFTYRGKQYEQAKRLTIGELAFCEDKFGKDFTEFRSAQQMLAMWFCSIKRVDRSITWEEIANALLDEIEDVPDPAEPEAPAEVREEDLPLDPTVAGTPTDPPLGSGPTQ
jgi:hypothetical protein